MRPVRLEMEGFAAFRERTVVDFTGAEYFALVGPTGAGKSTVIDALTFALYGTVPRWDDRRAVALGLAPSVNRGVVRLAFDVRDDRYVAVRELRRSARGGVNVKNARLERLLDRDDVDGDTEPLAADSGVTKAVEQLLGLSFEHFTSCVVLPQGDFAEFLHAKPGDRQAILTRLLGLGVYERIAREANREASVAGDRAALLAEQLSAYADATDEAVAEADRRVVALAALSERVTALLPELSAAAEAVGDADAAVATLRAEQARLSALTPPAGLEALEGRRRAADEAVRLARTRFSEAEAADDAARALVAAAPERGPLEQARRDHADLAAALGARPAAVEALATARAAEEKAVRQAEEAEEVAAAAVAARESAVLAATAAKAASDRLADECALLTGVQSPTGLNVVQSRRAVAVTALESARERLAVAEAAEAAARDRLAAAPERGPLEQARRDHVALDAAQVAEPAAASRYDEACRARAEAADGVAAARAALAAALGRRDSAVRADLAAALRPSLVVGEPCPVCAQHVATLPPPLPGADLAALESAVARAQQGLEGALAAEADAVAAQRQAAAERDRLAAEVARLRDAVAAAERAFDGSWWSAARWADGPGAGGDVAVHADGLRAGDPADRRRPGGAAGAQAVPAAEPTGPASAGASAPGRRVWLGSVAAVDAVLAELDALVAAAAEADEAVRAARRTRDRATAEVEAIQRELAAAAGALRTARDPLVPLGAPSPADDPVAGWSALVAWAAEARAEREAALPDAQRAAATTGATAEDAARAAETAGAEVVARRREATAAARAEQQARGRVEALDERVAVLRAALAGAPSLDQVDAELARRSELEESSRAADAALRLARTARVAAEEAADDVRRVVTAGWETLRDARDPLVGLGAPASLGDDLAAAWAQLEAWAQREVAERADRLPAAVAAATATRARLATMHSRLGAALAAEGVIVTRTASDDGFSRSDVPVGQAVRAVGGVVKTDGSAGDLAGDAAPRADSGSADGATVSVEAAVAAVAAALAHAEAVRDRLIERRAEAAGKRAAQVEAEDLQQVARMLGGLLRSDRFPRWLVASALDTLVADASVGLAELSGGQFELTHEEGEFLVVDHADADARRPVKTLSGGETFQASLALALALSAQMSTLAAEGAARLDSIFLDEGFGTLDEANLDVVAGTLEHLAGRGDRMVGVITHVPGLAERVPVRFTVRRDQRSARIEREGG